jgi:hypothetical protein
MDLLLVVDKHTSIGEISEFVDNLKVGKISHYKEMIISKNDLTRKCVSYAIEKKKTTDQEKKCIRIVFNYWYDTELGHVMYNNIQQGQCCIFPNTWRFYYEVPLSVHSNPYNYTAQTFLHE